MPGSAAIFYFGISLVFPFGKATFTVGNNFYFLSHFPTLIGWGSGKMAGLSLLNDHLHIALQHRAG